MRLEMCREGLPTKITFSASHIVFIFDLVDPPEIFLTIPPDAVSLISCRATMLNVRGESTYSLAPETANWTLSVRMSFAPALRAHEPERSSD
jgi:hypothetical protein